MITAGAQRPVFGKFARESYLENLPYVLVRAPGVQWPHRTKEPGCYFVLECYFFPLVDLPEWFPDPNVGKKKPVVTCEHKNTGGGVPPTVRRASRCRHRAQSGGEARVDDCVCVVVYRCVFGRSGSTVFVW